MKFQSLSYKLSLCLGDTQHVRENKVKNLIPFDLRSCYCVYSFLNLQNRMCQKRHIGTSSRQVLKVFMCGLKSDHAVSLDLSVCAFILVKVRN